MYTILTFTASSSFYSFSLIFVLASLSALQSAVGNLMGKMIKQKTLAYAKITQHKCSDIQLQYLSKIFTEPKTQLPYSHHPASFAILSYKNSVHILISCLLNIPDQYLLHKKIIHILPIKTVYEFLFSHMRSTIYTPSQLTWAVSLRHLVGNKGIQLEALK